MITLNDYRPHPLISLGINQGSQIFNTSQQFEKGNHYIVEAPSGKGKSTFLHQIYGLRKDYDGDIQWLGKDIRVFTHDQWADIRKQELSIVFQDLRLFLQLTALENIQLKANLTQHKTKEEIQLMAKRLGVEELLNQPAATLSYGQRQRISIIRALCQPFRFLLLDEPFSHLDEANTQTALAMIQEACTEQEAGIILVSLGESYSLPAKVLQL